MTIVIAENIQIVPRCGIILYFNFILLNFDVYLIHGKGSWNILNRTYSGTVLCSLLYSLALVEKY